MSARYCLFRFCGYTALTLLALARAAAAACTPAWIEPAASHWCFAFGGTFDADASQPGAGGEINRTNRQADGPLFEHGRHSLGAGIHYDSFELDEGGTANLDLYRIELRYRLQYGEGLALHLAPALATSSNRIFEDMARDDVLLQAALTYRWRQPGILTGLVRDARLGSGLRSYPVVSVPLSFDNGIHGAVGFPDTHFGYEGRDWNWALRLGPAGYSWHVLDGSRNVRFDVKMMRWELGVTTGRRRQPRFFVNAGIAFAREIAFTTLSGQRVDTELDATLFARVGLRLGSLDPDTKSQRE